VTTSESPVLYVFCDIRHLFLPRDYSSYCTIYERTGWASLSLESDACRVNPLFSVDNSKVCTYVVLHARFLKLLVTPTLFKQGTVAFVESRCVSK
jgi:hypothetical protein